MLRETTSSIALIKAIRLGYTIDKEGMVYNPKNVFLKGYTPENGYTKYSIRVDGKKSTFGGHQIQAYTKFGESVFDTPCVRHMNNIKTDNSWDNIEIGSHHDNGMDNPKTQRILNASNPIHSHTDIIKDRECGMSYKNIMEKYGISAKGTVSFIINKSLKSTTKDRSEV